MTNPRIPLIHVTPLAVQPVADAFKLLWPQARLVQYAKTYGANAILSTQG